MYLAALPLLHVRQKLEETGGFGSHRGMGTCFDGAVGPGFNFRGTAPPGRASTGRDGAAGQGLDWPGRRRWADPAGPGGGMAPLSRGTMLRGSASI